MRNSEEKYLPDTVLLSSELASDNDVTQLLYNSMDDESTTILSGNVKVEIICTRTNQAVNITESSFKIGSSKTADFYVGDNSTISRIHAVIELGDDGCFYIMDNNSSNNSYFEGVQAIPNTRYRLFSGSRFILSNEEFIFSIR
ncbi:MAG: FHA domain-containing protein [Eubacterium sp.]|nr:FHA domain-containing protein [Eubacterium sp.]